MYFKGHFKSLKFLNILFVLGFILFFSYPYIFNLNKNHNTSSDNSNILDDKSNGILDEKLNISVDNKTSNISNQTNKTNSPGGGGGGSSSMAIDNVYPTFFEYSDNNATLVNFGFALFNVSVSSSNGTVLLEINGITYLASNIGGNNYSVYVNLSHGTYDYLWYSYGSGSNNNYNLSMNRSYFIDYDPVYPTFYNFLDNNYELNNTGTANFNVSINNTNGTVYLRINSQYYLATNFLSNNYNVSASLNSAGTYGYYWYSYGNGSWSNYIASNSRNYIVNGSFVTIDSSWLSNQGNSPYYLNSSHTTYTLDTDISSNGTAFAIMASNITLDLNGHKVFYDNSPKININNGDFELEKGNNITGWNFSLAPNMSVVNGTYVQPVSAFSGNNALFIYSPCVDQNITSNNFILKANTTYVLSANLLNDGEENPLNEYSNVTLFVMLNGTTVNITQEGYIWRRFSHWYTIFTTDSTDKEYYLIAGIRSTGNITTPRTLYMDNIKITRYTAHGVLIGATGWMPNGYSDVNQYGSASDIILKNGYIIQGEDNGEQSDGVVIGEGGDHRIEISNITINVSGPDSKNIEFIGDSSNSLDAINIHDNILNNNVTTVQNRMHYDGAMILLWDSLNSSIYNNVLYGGSHMGIVDSGKSTTIHNQIYNNSIILYSRYSNDFAISSANSDIYDNSIYCAYNDRSCRGIFVGSNSIVYNNNITVQNIARNQEYNGCEGAGAYGMQAEATKNSQVYGNNVTAYGENCPSIAFRSNGFAESGGGVNVSVYNNTFTAIANGTAMVSSVKIGDSNATTLSLFNNTLFSNRAWLFYDAEDPAYGLLNLTFTSNYFGILDNLDSNFNPLRSFNWNDVLIIGVRFIDNRYQNSTVEDYFRRTSVKDCTSGNCDSYYDLNSSYLVVWGLNITVVNVTNTAIPNATIRLYNNSGNLVNSSSTDANGNVYLYVDELLDVGGTKNYYSNYSINVSKSSYSNLSRILNMTSSLSLNLSIS